MGKVSDEELTMEDFLDHYGLESFVEEEPKRSISYRFLKGSGALMLFVVVSIVAGLLLSIVPLTLGASTVFAMEPAVKVWKSIPDTVPNPTIAERNRLYDINGNVYAELWAENRIEVKDLQDISVHAQQALIDTEDKRFYDHNGFDVKGTFRAALSGHGGGSGITQQLVKNLQFFDYFAHDDNKASATEKTYARKIRELKMSLRYEKEHSKEEILLNYFNTVAFGAPNIYGIETASKYFFGKPAKNLSIAESAALIGTVKNPVGYSMKNPDNYQKWKNRQETVLRRMLAEGSITEEEFEKAKNEKLSLVMKENNSGTCWTSKYPMYCEYVLSYLMNSPRLGETREDRERVLAQGGLQIQTYLDPKSMQIVNEELKKSFGNKNRVVAPTAVVQPGTGGVLAIGQNRDWGNGEGKSTLNTTLKATGEGSVYKMFTLAAALNNGYTRESLDFSSDCPLRPGRKYDSPKGGFKNSVSCEKQGGKMNYKTATAYSSNTWFVALEMKISVEKVKEFSKSVGLRAPDNIGNRSLSYTLGTVGNTPVDAAAALATFSNNGVFCPAKPVSEIRYADGSQLKTPDTYNPKTDACRAVMTPYASSVVLEAMRANVQGEIKDAFGVKGNVPGYDTVAKSGTNGNYNLSWAQLSKQYSVYQNIYDMEKTNRGIDTIRFRGYSAPWHKNSAMLSGSTIMKQLLKGHPNQKLNYSAKEKTYKKTPIDETSFFTVPTVVGMSPEQAVTVMNNAGITAQVSKTVVTIPEGYTDGVVAEQSIPAGTVLAKGTEKEVILYVGGK